MWLDSGNAGCDVIVADPVRQIHGNGLKADAIAEAMRDGLGEVEALPHGSLFAGGWVGHIGYEAGRQWMGLPQHDRQRLSDDVRLGLYDWVVVVDHAREQAHLVSLGRYASTREHWGEICARFSPLKVTSELLPLVSGPTPESDMTSEAYAELFAHLQRYIRDGDVYQVNLTRRWNAQSNGDAFDLYRCLRALSPAPYGAFLDFGDYQVLSNSPEQFVSLQEGIVRTRPIKGTRPRGRDVQQDAQLLADLVSSEKDRAENLMIVDLLRNDLGKVCRPGSIEVPSLFSVESFAKVHHLVSTVSGELDDGYDAIDLFLACFPGGSITGAPKRRAMEIIDELEPLSRELYCGSILRWGYDGNLDSSITIRTLLRCNQQLYYWAGGGVVADSDAQDEYREAADKAAAFIALLAR